MVEIIVKHPLDMTAGEESQWQALRSGVDVWRNPFFSPAFTLAVARLRADARVAFVRDGDEIRGVFAFHARPFGLARPIGAPLCDWHGPILSPTLKIDLAEIIAGAGVAAVRLPGLADPFDHFATKSAAVESHIANLSDGFDALFARLAATRPHHAKNMRRRFRKAEREAGPPSLIAASRDPALFDQLIAWKRAQYAATGKHDVLASPWVVQLLRTLATDPSPGLRAEMYALKLGDKLVAVELFLREGAVLHAWFPAYDPASAAFSPGHLLNELVLRHAAAQGVARVEFGPGDDDFKRSWSDQAAPIFEAVVHAPGPLGRLRAAGQNLWAKAETKPIAGKIRRRLDMIVAADADWSTAAMSLAKTAFAR